MSTIPEPAAASPWNPWLRAGVSVVLLLHLVGVMVAPITTPPQFEGGPSVLGAKLKEYYEPYITAAYLDHSYKFFAPNPGDSHLLRYDLYFADGTSRINQPDQILPDRHHDWPRLHYHRHFMLTESINDYAPLEVWEGRLNPNPNAALLSPVAAAEPQGEAVPSAPAERLGPPPFAPVYLDGIARYLAMRHGAMRVDLFYRKHKLPRSMEEFQRGGRRLDSPESYLDRLVATYSTEAKR